MTAPVLVRHESEVDRERSTCGWRYRLISTGDDDAAAWSHVVDIDGSRDHYHKRAAELYYVLEGEGVVDEIKSLEKALGEVEGAGKIKSDFTKARRALEKKPDSQKAHAQILEAAQRHSAEVRWRLAAQERLLPALENFDKSISRTIGLRLQERLLTNEAEEIASCQSVHRDVSLEF